jgi:hypothetical protein
MEFPQEIKVDLSHHPAIPFLHVYPEEMKSAYQIGVCIPLFIVALSMMPKIWNKSWCLTVDE